MEMKWGQYHKYKYRYGHHPSWAEQTIEDVLEEEHLIYKGEWSHNSCRSELGYNLFFDFAIFKNKDDKLPCCIIEYQGVQHYIEDKSMPGAHTTALQSDKIKREFCNSNNIPLIEFEWKDLHDDDNHSYLKSKIKEMKKIYCEDTKIFEFF